MKKDTVNPEFRKIAKELGKGLKKPSKPKAKKIKREV